MKKITLFVCAVISLVLALCLTSCNKERINDTVSEEIVFSANVQDAIDSRSKSAVIPELEDIVLSSENNDSRI